MVLSVQNTIKIKCYSGIKCIYQSQKMNIRNLQKKEYGLNKVYDSDVEQAPKILNGTLFCTPLKNLKYFFH